MQQCFSFCCFFLACTYAIGGCERAGSKVLVCIWFLFCLVFRSEGNVKMEKKGYHLLLSGELEEP